MKNTAFILTVLLIVSCNTNNGTKIYTGNTKSWNVEISKKDWSVPSKKQVPDSDFELLHHSGKAYLIAISQKGELAPDVLEAIAIDKLMGALPEAELKTKIMVGLDSINLLHVATTGQEGDNEIIYDGWFYSGKEGTIQLIFRVHCDYLIKNTDLINNVLKEMRLDK